MIKVLLDQNIPATIETWLQEKVGQGATILSTRKLGMARFSDVDIFNHCQQNAMIIITYDDDFQNPHMIPKIPGYGVVRLNVYPTGASQTREALTRLLNKYPIKEWEKASIVVDAHKIRYSKRQV